MAELEAEVSELRSARRIELEREANRAALFESEARAAALAGEHAAVLGQIAEGVIMADASGRITFVNEAAARIHGTAALGILPEGYSAAYCLLTEDRRPYPAGELPLTRAVLRGETVTEARWRIRRPDGSEVLAVGSARPLLARDGTREGAVLTLRDETARDAAEQALRESEARFRSVFDQQFQSMAVLSPEGVTLEINDLALRAAGIARDQVIGRFFWDTPFWAGLPAMRAAWPGRLVEAKRTDGPVLSEDLYQTADGTIRVADAAVTAVRGAGGAVRFFVIQASDITERKLAEAALKTYVAEFRAIFETAAAGVTEVDLRTGRYLRVNRRFCEIVGRTEAELLAGLGPDDLSHPEDRGANAAALAAASADGRHELERRYLRPDGIIVWVRASAAVAARDARGRATRTVAVVQDITERKRAEQRQALLVAELNHRVKNALATVQAVADQTLRSTGGDARQFAVDFPSRLRTLATAHDLLTQRGWEPASLGEVARVALAPWLEEGGGERVFLAGAGENDAMVSPRQAQALVLALHELATNAAKHGALSQAGGCVKLSCITSDAGFLTLEWSEIGGPPITKPPVRRGFGIRMLERALPQDLGSGGSVELRFEHAGLHALIRLSSLPDNA
jgi:PAS domain S-box-containing protein